jgi:alpha-D-xyloside xylohydrolase
MLLSGIQWWTFDIGGYGGGNADDDAYRELYVRWFQYAGFVPIMRAHGDRSCSHAHPGFQKCPNEPWSFGEAAYPRLVAAIESRQRLRPYIDRTAQRGIESGRPMMRPLFMDFPSDGSAAGAEDVYMFGDALLVAPVLFPGAISRDVYLPALPGQATWYLYWDRSQHFTGGQQISVPVTMERIPVFMRADVEDAKLLPMDP